MMMIELFSGSGEMSKAFECQGFETFKIDDNPRLKSDFIVDIGKLTSRVLRAVTGRPDVIWSSPPCTCFSRAAGSKYWLNREPAAQETLKAIELHKHALGLIRSMEPDLYFIENPEGHLQFMEFMADIPRYKITYCQYGYKFQKPTHIWTNHPTPAFKMPCKKSDKCHEQAPRGAGKGLKASISNAQERAVIPRELCDHIARISRKYIDTAQDKNKRV